MGLKHTLTETIHKFPYFENRWPNAPVTWLLITVEINGTDFRKTVKRTEQQIGRKAIDEAHLDNFDAPEIVDMIQEARMAIKRDIDRANAWLEGTAA